MGRRIFYTGSYTQKGRAGIKCFLFDSKKGTAGLISYNTDVECPSYLCFGNDRKCLYCVSETPDEGAVHSFKILPDGSLIHTGEIPSSGGYTCYLSVSRDGRYLAAAGFESGDIDIYLLTDEGVLSRRIYQLRRTGKSVHPERQGSAHVHCTAFSPYEDRLFVTDLGTDEFICFQYSDDVFTELYRVSFPKGSGPRHILFDRTSENILYVDCEISYTLCAVEIGEAGGRVVAVSDCIEPGFDDYGGAAAVRMDRSGRMYVSNRIMQEPKGRDCISVFEADGSKEPHLIKKVSCGENPRDMNVLGDYLVAGYLSEGMMEIRRLSGTGVIDEVPSCRIPVDNISCITELIETE